MAETYTYDVDTDFPDGKIDTTVLQDEIAASSISTPLLRIDTVGGAPDAHGIVTGGTVDIVFDATLSAADKTTLDGDTTGPAGGLIAAHDTNPHLTALYGQDRIEYQTISTMAIGEVIYTKAEVVPGTYKKIRIFVSTVGLGAGMVVKAGVHDDLLGEPDAKLAEGSYTIQEGDDNSFIDIPLASDFVANEIGNIWISLLGDGNTVSFVSTSTLVSIFHDVRFETVLDGNIPASPSPDAAVSGTVLFAELRS